MRERRSKEDDVQQISISLFVTNFPYHFSFRDLWRVCDEYGKVVDVFIPTRRSKSGNRYAFVRYIKIDGTDRLVKNLYTVWVGRLRLHANVVRFQRKPRNIDERRHGLNGETKLGVGKQQQEIGQRSNRISYADVINQGKKPTSLDECSTLALVLDNSCVLQRDFSLSLMGKVKDFGSISNIYVLLAKEGFENIKLRYLGGFWVLIDFQSITSKDHFVEHVGVGSWFSTLQQTDTKYNGKERVTWVDIEGVPLHVWTQNTFMQIASKWGEFMYAEDSDETYLHRKRLCIKVNSENNIFYRIVKFPTKKWMIDKSKSTLSLLGHWSLTNLVTGVLQRNDEVKTPKS